ncbi:MAG: AAA family ATPase [Proteobacteria bacterium]|nr:AAA family ATPase [Pseudomonadota bacterium]
MDRNEAHQYLQQSLRHIKQRIMGQENVIEQLICCFIAGGHILMTGAPGLGKTLLVKVFSEYLGLSFGRIQYTPDLLPSDITGSEVIQFDDSQGKRHFEFIQGPIFSHLVLADEINRASPRTQAAMLESMQEGSVTYNGKTYQLPTPFMVCATQNPFESEGTYPLPEAQLDRFLIHALVEHPNQNDELAILKNYHTRASYLVEDNPEMNKTEVTKEHINTLISHAEATKVSDEIFELVNSLVRATRKPLNHDGKEELSHLKVRFGAGPRGGLALITTAKSLAFLQGASEVRWHHIKKLACPVLRHRVSLHYNYAREFKNIDDFLNQHMAQLETNHHLKNIIQAAS